MLRMNRCLLFTVCFILSAVCVYSADTLKSEIGWVGLYNEEMLGWLENQNRIDTLCPQTLGSAFQQCRDEKLKSRTWKIDVSEKPEAASAKIGTLAVTAIPGVGLTAVFHSLNASIEFTPDLFEADWGYGPYFHQTFRDNRNDWFLLPQNPLPKPGWINISQLTNTPDRKTLSNTEVYKLNGNGVVLINIQNTIITLRTEQPADMWCKEGNPPQLKPSQGRDVPLSHLLTRDGHLKLKIKYMKGC